MSSIDAKKKNDSASVAGGISGNNSLYSIFFFLISTWRRHNDLPWQLVLYVDNKLQDIDLNVRPNFNITHTDIPRLRAGLVGAQVSSTGAKLDLFEGKEGGGARVFLLCVLEVEVPPLVCEEAR